MAEILGVVASGLAVAEVGLKVGGTVWKLKKLWQEVHQVPATIQDLMRQIEMMDPILSDHETTLGNQSIAFPRQLPTLKTGPAISSAAYCREALSDLRRLVDDLDGAVESEKRSRRTVARMRVVLKKDTIKGFQDRLEKAIRLLQSTQVSYLAANAAITGAMVTNMWTAVTDIQAQQQLILQQLNNNSSSSTGKPPFPVITQYAKTSQEQAVDKRRRVQRQGHGIYVPWSGPTIFGAIMFRKSESDAAGESAYAVRFQLPRWLSQSVWDISIIRACSGWQAAFSTLNVVPGNSPGMLCVKNGDLDGLLELFDRRLASPQDCDVYGETLFHVACTHSHTHIVNYFINMNLDTMNPTAMDIATVGSIFEGTMPIDIIWQLSSRGSFHLLANSVEDFEFYNETMKWDSNHFLSAWCLPFASQRQELLEFCLHTYFPFWGDLRPRRKDEILLATTATGFCNWTADGLRHVICPDGPIRRIDTKAWNDDGVSVLHVIFYHYLMQFLKAEAEDFETLLEEAIQATDDVHHASKPDDFFTDISENCSALQEGLILSLTHGLELKSTIESNARTLLERLTRALQSLMSVLASCGYDLLEFGRREAVAWVDQCNAGSNVGRALYLGFRYDEVREVRAVHYGAEPRDWYFEVDFHYEDYAGVFWTLIENPHLFMVPGAWVDEE